MLQLDSDEFTLENAITRSFDKIVRLHLDPVWHQLSGKTKQLVTDIKTLRLVLEYVLWLAPRARVRTLASTSCSSTYSS